jgi:hypothetical protein
MIERTAKAAKFMLMNIGNPIVAAAWKQADGGEAVGPPETWTHIRYIFEDGRGINLTRADMDTIAPELMMWKGSKAA